MPPDPSSTSLLVTLGAAVLTGGVGAGVVNGLLGRRKSRADTDKTTADTAVTLMREMRQDMSDLRRDVAELEEWKHAAEGVFDQLRDQGVPLDLTSLPGHKRKTPTTPPRPRKPTD